MGIHLVILFDDSERYVKRLRTIRLDTELNIQLHLWFISTENSSSLQHANVYIFLNESETKPVDVYFNYAHAFFHHQQHTNLHRKPQ